jgi:hypothetical protein
MAKNDMRALYVFAFKAMSEITAIILLPAIAAYFLRLLYLGEQHSNLIFTASLIVAFILSMSVATKKIQSYGKEFKQLTGDSPEPPASSGGSARG